MKTIKLTESQLRLIFEDDGPGYDDGSIKKFGDNTEIGTSAVVHDKDGNPEFGDMPETDEIGDFLAVQNWWGNAHNGGRVVP